MVCALTLLLQLLLPLNQPTLPARKNWQDCSAEQRVIHGSRTLVHPPIIVVDSQSDGIASLASSELLFALVSASAHTPNANWTLDLSDTSTTTEIYGR